MLFRSDGIGGGGLAELAAVAVVGAGRAHPDAVVVADGCLAAFVLPEAPDAVSHEGLGGIAHAVGLGVVDPHLAPAVVVVAGARRWQGTRHRPHQRYHLRAPELHAHPLRPLPPQLQARR